MSIDTNSAAIKVSNLNIGGFTMLNYNYTASLIGMEDAIVTNLEKDSRTKVIKLNAYGMRNFENFRARILHVMNS